MSKELELLESFCGCLNVSEFGIAHPKDNERWQVFLIESFLNGHDRLEDAVIRRKLKEIGFTDSAVYNLMQQHKLVMDVLWKFTMTDPYTEDLKKILCK